MLRKFIQKECISLELQSKNKADVIDELIGILDKAGKLNDREIFKKEILKREAQSSTGLEEGIAIPHAKTAAVKVPSIAIGISKEGLDYESLDGEVSRLFFMIAAAEGAEDTHIELLSKLSTILLEDEVREALLHAKSKEEVIQMLEDEMAKEEEEESFLKPEISQDFPEVLAVTACPTGIAHTYMAADSLRKKAEEMGVNIKVETNGSTGVKYELTAEEIKAAKGIIVAADKNVEMERFAGKHVEIVPVKEGIKNPQNLIQNALQQKAPIYQSTAGTAALGSAKKERTGFYKHLMSGVSNMLPFVVGGGILIAICFMFGIKAFDPNDPSYHPFAKLVNDIGGGNAFFLMIPVLAGFIGMSIADRPGFAPAMVGGLIAMNNGGGFLGGLIGGFLGGYSIVFLKKVFAKLPESLEGIKPVLLYPLFGMFITGSIMYQVIVGPIATINNGLTGFLNNLGTGNLVLLGIVLAVMMSTDMGGPINKAAFTFGIATIAAGNYAPHAAVMAGGMVPPLGIALATTLFQNKFTEDERTAGKTCYILGLSFITEGAIPFAASDPIRVIPSCMVGAGIAGALTMLFGVQLPAPHGGIFVIPVVTHPVQYLLAIGIGSLVTAVLLGILKKSK
ncbi:PTS system fructose-specific EIIABC component [Fusobacterium necrophorum subsp. funduliforme ATCC 51357]|uniref:PTS fructose transporter subunit IIA n=1 Tax=Fusobacterium necrophorum subsp. funduliforme TaxID=143387 RepID=A0A162J9M7_9FUSO|nr:fructose-specific PTS transporter subunit EIIC [Fusobacterium necrophorum]AYV92937.1 PTS fructose transporter subunit IIA [Fusobacterium necrophorum subsp. funduliforme]EIJ68948.1 PTS system fructose-specific EIIABC component [Fusobacterium necrophorum subsp. funduliforme ATCC 51357]KAB0554074.1 PTS fructose transporter subunit IIA [Fusobacterium necrophorum subsp. funduliforme]KYL05390.1 PTS fructose transporter subunit IIA [Fusobacterium necrophorum subsp. funduliforme]KYM45304.1 PTS fruc